MHVYVHTGSNRDCALHVFEVYGNGFLYNNDMLLLFFKFYYFFFIIIILLFASLVLLCYAPIVMPTGISDSAVIEIIVVQHTTPTAAVSHVFFESTRN